MSAAFETSATRGLAADAVLECGVCWWVYDPAVGDPVRDIAPGAPFSALPADWRCPKCDAPAAQFMVKGAVAAGPSEPGAETMEARARKLTSGFSVMVSAKSAPAKRTLKSKIRRVFMVKVRLNLRECGT